jgi:AraC-like DNA-binding protein
MQPFARTASLTGYVDLCRSLGLDAARLMDRVGLDIGDLAVPDRWVPAGPMARLLELSARESGCDDFAVRMSELRRLGSLGPLSVALREEPDLRGVLDLLSRFEHVYTGVLDLRLVEQNGLVSAQIHVRFGEPVPVVQVQNLIAANIVGIVRTLIRADWEPASASFSHPEPRELAAFHRIFGRRLHFGAGFTGVTFEARDLDAPVVMSDASVRPYARRFLRTMGPSPETSPLAAQADRVVELLLPLGRCSLDEVGRHLGLGPRLLQQRLAAEGRSFSAVVHGTRARMAEHYLSIDRFSLTEISQLLGFAAPSAFTRWFRQQFGTSPTRWRDSALVQPAPVVARSGLVRPRPAPRSSAAGTPSRPGSAGAGG